MGQRSKRDMLEILTQDAPSTPTPFLNLLRSQVNQAAQGIETKTQFRITSKAQHPNPLALLLWVSPIFGSSSLSFEEAQTRCYEYLNNIHDIPNCTCITLLRADEFGGDTGTDIRRILIVLSKAEDTHSSTLLFGQDEERPEDAPLPGWNDAGTSPWTRLQLRWPWRNGYRTLQMPNKSPLSWNYLKILCSASALVILALVITLLVIRGGSDDIYDRYITTGSLGPKHQLRIYWQNASEWAAANPQDTGKWKVRIDDQAIIPAELYDDDEENYQQWYRHRYPEMQQVIDNRDYIRPSWMGSLSMMVPWDDQFHFAHCVLALRRYWKAKETGRHVCGRDIDYLHIDHCLSSLEKRVFVDGPRKIEDPPTYMYWQTKVCF